MLWLSVQGRGLNVGLASAMSVMLALLAMATTLYFKRIQGKKNRKPWEILLRDLASC
jgi:ABC-type sugar transport system permease subunit